jgi:hypothetical protein
MAHGKERRHRHTRLMRLPPHAAATNHSKYAERAMQFMYACAFRECKESGAFKSRFCMSQNDEGTQFLGEVKRNLPLASRTIFDILKKV